MINEKCADCVLGFNLAQDYDGSTTLLVKTGSYTPYLDALSDTAFRYCPNCGNKNFSREVEDVKSEI